MGGSVKKVIKKTAELTRDVSPVSNIIDKKEEKRAAKKKQLEADNAILTKEVESTNAAAKAFEAEQKKKEKRQMGLGSAISGSDSNL
jgi:PBP1b-binding outer membrane lipoprotein LpoB